MKTNLRQFAAKIETTPGTVETIAAADVNVKLKAGTFFELDADQFDPEELQDTSDVVPVSMGRKLVAFPTEYVLRAPGSLTTTPEIADLIKAASFSGAAAKTINIGSITGGPYVAGEIITGTTSSATGMVLQKTATGASNVPYLPITGTLVTTETITGGTSGATATTSAGPASAGYAWRPAEIGEGVSGNHVTCKAFQDGFAMTARGCLADLSIAFEACRPAVVTQRFQGAYSAHADDALLTGVSLSVASTAPELSNMGMLLGSYGPTGIDTFTLDWPVTVSPLLDANDTASDCVKYMEGARDVPTVTIEPSMVAKATKDYLGDLIANTTASLEWTLGDTSGNRFTFAAPAAQIVDFGSGERDPKHATAPITLRLTGDNNNSLLIWQH